MNFEVDLVGALKVAQRVGWSEVRGSLESLRMQVVASDEWQVAEARSTSDQIEQLQPKEPARAHPESLSAQFGMDEFPLHTDGAHRAVPPDFVILECPQRPSTVETTLARPNLEGSQRTSLRMGMFSVWTGREHFLSSALDETGRLRFDPGVMTPLDWRARAANEYLSGYRDQATPFFWSGPGVSLVIDNRRALHGRGSAVDEPERNLHRLCIRRKA